MIVLDTNVISEVMRPQPSVHVLAWLNQQTSLHLFVTSVSVAEIGYGLRALVDGQRRRILQNRFEQFIAKGFLISKMIQPAPKTPSFRQGSRNPEPWMVTCSTLYSI